VKVRVLQIVAAAIPDENGKRGVNGPERRSANVIGYWAENQIEPVYAYSSNGRLVSDFASSGYTVVDFQVNSKFDFLSVVRIVYMLLKNRIDIVHTQGPGSLDLFASISCVLTGKKLIVTRPVMISDLRLSDIKKMVFEVFDRITMWLADGIVCVSSDGHEHLVLKYPNYEHKIKKIFNGVKTNRGGGLNKPFSHPFVREGDFVVSMCAQLTYNKGWFDYLDVVGRLSNVIPNLKALIIGGGPLFSDIEHYILSNNLDNVVFMVGHTNHVQHFMSVSDVYIMTSYREGLSVAVLEAMASSLPLVLYDFSGSSDQVNNDDNGYVVLTGDVEAVVSKVLYMYKNNKMKSMGERSFEIYSNTFTEDVMVQRYAKLYHDVCVNV